MARQSKMWEPTRMVTIRSGNETGIYYVPISNLPFHTDPICLKDFVEVDCTVHSLQIFPTSTSGWVCLWGKENFDRAWDRLNGGVFNDRLLIASDKNKSETIHVKEVILDTEEHVADPTEIPTSSPSSRSSLNARAPPFVTPRRPSDAESDATTADGGIPFSPGLWPKRGDIWFPIAWTHLYLPPFGTEYPPSPPSSIAPSSIAPSSVDGGALLYSPSSPQSQSLGNGSTTNVTEANMANRSDSPGYYYDENRGAIYPNTEQSKVYVQSLHYRASLKEVKAWVHWTAGNLAKHICAIEIPRKENKPSELRGHAIIHFRKIHYARSAVRVFHNTVFKGRTIHAWLIID